MRKGKTLLEYMDLVAKSIYIAVEKEVADDVAKTLKDAAERIQELEAKLKEREWVSVEERLPEIPKGLHSVTVLAYVVDECCSAGNHISLDTIYTERGFECYIGETEDGRNPITGEETSWCGFEYLGEKVTHWMPLPPSPEEE